MQEETSFARTTLPELDHKVKHIIPDYLTEALWINMLTKEDADELMAEFMDELQRKVMDCCFEMDIERQIIPFTLFWTKSYLTQTVDRQILCLDEGGEEEASRTEDSEPMPATPDSWAQGCVPVLYASHQPFHTSHQEVNTDQVPLQTGTSVKKKCNVFSLKNSPLQYSDIDDPKSSQSPSTHVSEAHSNALSPLPQLKTNRKEKQWLNLVSRNVPSRIPPSLFSSTEKQSTELKGKNNECCFYKDKTAPACQQRDRQSIPKLDPSCLPRHFILTEYEIMDNKHSEPKPQKSSALPKPEAKLSKLTLTSLKPLTSSKDQPEKFQKRKDDKVCASKHENEHLSSGPQRKTVSLLDPNAVEMNHLKSKYPSPSSRLKPVQSKPAVPLFSVDEVTAGPPPKVTPLLRSRHHDI